VPAISSTNSIVASVEIIEALKYIARLKSKSTSLHAKEVFVQNDAYGKINSVKSDAPREKC
jgi:hypothetical protein